MSTTTRTPRPRRLGRTRLLGRSRRGAGAASPVASDALLRDVHLEVLPGEIVAAVCGDARERTAVLRALAARASRAAGTLGGVEVEIADEADPARLRTAAAGERVSRPAAVLGTRDLDAAIAHADRIIVLGQGRILHQVHLTGAHPRDLAGDALTTLRERIVAALRGQPALV